MRAGSILGAAVILALGGLAGMALAPLWSGRDAFAPCRDRSVASGRLGDPFTLVDARGEVVTDREVLAGPAILYFGYASCADECPLDLARNAEAVDLLEERGWEVVAVFITTDPARDRPEVVGAYAEAFHPRMIGLTGSPDQVRAAARAFGIGLAPRQGGADAGPVAHSTGSYLVLPGARVADVIGRDAPAEAVADRMACLIEAASA